MFTGIIEAIGKIESVERDGDNFHYKISSPISDELKVDQSVAHEGACLTVTRLEKGAHWVTAVKETLDKTNLGQWKAGKMVNLERSMKLGDRLDGHIVQGHVDATGECLTVIEENGSWRFRFSYPGSFASLIVPKGSICINGTSLTAIAPGKAQFEVAIIPFTYEHTTFLDIKPGDKVNLEFDILGKYLARRMEFTSN